MCTFELDTEPGTTERAVLLNMDKGPTKYINTKRRK